MSHVTSAPVDEGNRTVLPLADVSTVPKQNKFVPLLLLLLFSVYPSVCFYNKAALFIAHRKEAIAFIIKHIFLNGIYH